jgi:serine/threonine-protein kinase RsbW
MGPNLDPGIGMLRGEWLGPGMAENRIALELSNVPEYLRLVRLVCADAGARAGFDYEEIDDLKLAVTELSSLLMTGDGNLVSIEFLCGASELAVEGRMPGLASPAEELSQTLVAVLVDEHQFTRSENDSSFRVRKVARVVERQGSPTPDGGGGTGPSS